MFIKLKLKLENILKEPLEKKVLDYFDFITWIESKVAKKEFRSLAKEKSGSVNGQGHIGDQL